MTYQILHLLLTLTCCIVAGAMGDINGYWRGFRRGVRYGFEEAGDRYRNK
jgi:membrane protein DedA with SNARE-associated domain